MEHRPVASVAGAQFVIGPEKGTHYQRREHQLLLCGLESDLWPASSQGIAMHIPQGWRCYTELRYYGFETPRRRTLGWLLAKSTTGKCCVSRLKSLPNTLSAKLMWHSEPTRRFHIPDHSPRTGFATFYPFRRFAHETIPFPETMLVHSYFSLAFKVLWHSSQFHMLALVSVGSVQAKYTDTSSSTLDLLMERFMMFLQLSLTREGSPAAERASPSRVICC